MNDQINVEMPCVEGCTFPDGNPRPARHGDYCTRCWARIDMALNLAGELASHLIGNAISTGSGMEEKITVAREAPLPFNQAAFDDANELYSALVYWCVTWARVLDQKPPKVAVGAWRNDRGTIIGLPVDVTPERAAEVVGVLTGWMRNRLDLILGSKRADDIEAMGETVQDVWRMNARWPRIERPAYSAVPCPHDDCGRRVAVYPPAFPGDTRRIVCLGGHWFPEDEYEHLVLVFEQEHRERKRTAKQTDRVVKHLAAKYGIGRTA